MQSFIKYKKVILLLWDQGKGLKSFKQNSGIIKFRLCKHHSGKHLKIYRIGTLRIKTKSNSFLEAEWT